MIRQVTAGFLIAAAKTHFQAALGEEAGEGRETRDTADREGSKQASRWRSREELQVPLPTSTWHPAQKKGPYQPLCMLLHK